MDAATIESIVNYVKAERICADYVVVAAIAMFLYDYVLTLSQEIKLLWFTPWNHIKFLFFLVRYMPFGAMYPLLSSQLFLDVPTEICRKTWPVTAVTIAAGVTFAEGLLMVRTWAVWHKNRYIGAGLAIVWIATFINGSYFISNFVKSFVINPKPYEGFRGCFLITTNTSPRETFIFLTVVEAVILILMMISAHKSYKYGSTSELNFVIHRDGIGYYVLLLASAIANVILMVAFQGQVEQLMAIPLQLNFQSILTTRMLLNIRETAHVNRTYAEPEISTLVFEMRPRMTVEGVRLSSDV